MVHIGPVSEGQDMIWSGTFSVRDAADDLVDSGGTARDLNVVLLGSTCKAALAESPTKVSDMIAVKVSVSAA